MKEFLFDMPALNVFKEDNAPIQGRKRIREANRNQAELKIASLDELIPEDHRVRNVWEYVLQLKISDFHENIKVTENSAGPPTIDPRILLTLWIYATLEGIASARHIARLCQEHYA